MWSEEDSVKPLRYPHVIAADYRDGNKAKEDSERPELQLDPTLAVLSSSPVKPC